MEVFPLIIGTSLFVLLMVACGVYILIRNRRWRARWNEVEAEVVRLEGYRPGLDPEGNRVWAVVHYRDHEGREHERRLPNTLRRSAVGTGDSLTIYFDPRRPYAGRLETGAEKTAAMVAFLMAAAAVAYLVVRLV